MQLHKSEGHASNTTEQLDSPKTLWINKKIKEALKTIRETIENLKELVNTQRDYSSIIPNKIKNVEEEMATNQIKINEYIELEKKTEHSVEELWNLIESNDTANKWYQVERKGNLFTLKNNHSNVSQNL